IERAIGLGPVSGELLRHAACLCARLARQDSRWVDSGIEYLRRAIALGQNPQELENDRGLTELQRTPQFQVLLRLPYSPGSTARTSRLVDPFPRFQRTLNLWQNELTNWNGRTVTCSPWRS